MNDLIGKYHTWKIQLTRAINFMLSKDNYEERVMHSRSINIELMINGKEDEVIEELFQYLSRYQIGFETSLKVVILSLIMLICCNTNVIE